MMDALESPVSQWSFPAETGIGSIGWQLVMGLPSKATSRGYERAVHWVTSLVAFRLDGPHTVTRRAP